MSIVATIVVLACAVLYGSYVLANRVIGRRIHRKRNRVLVNLLGALFVSFVVYVAGIGLFVAVMSYYPHRSFDARSWATNPDDRYMMVDDLEDKYLRIGESQEQVRSLLGSDENNPADDEWSYTLGIRPELFNIDPDVLVVTFHNDRVSGIHTTRR
ncbi:MAG: hypothetical protein JSS75_08665 [Bacteroidetes bacterium]|nr:hypothetical protein [Bacteroidota bacterium]